MLQKKILHSYLYRDVHIYIFTSKRTTNTYVVLRNIQETPSVASKCLNKVIYDGRKLNYIVSNNNEIILTFPESVINYTRTFISMLEGVIDNLLLCNGVNFNKDIHIAKLKHILNVQYNDVVSFNDKKIILSVFD